jgi:hypothetical protein
MKTPSLLVAALGFLPGLLFAAPLQGQEAEASSDGRPLINLTFPGGTVAEYVEAVLKVAKDINIVVMPEAREFEVPPLQLTGVDVGSAMSLLDDRTEPRGHGVVELSVSEIEPFQGNGRPIFTISSSLGPPAKERPSEAAVWTISDLIGSDISAQAVLTAIQTSIDLTAPLYGPAEIKFHEATGLVIAQGHVQQMNTIENVIKRLREGLERTLANRSGRGAAEDGVAVKSQFQTLSDRLTKAEQRVSQLEAEKADLEARIAKLAESQRKSVEQAR